jgi:alpha-amylase
MWARHRSLGCALLVALAVGCDARTPPPIAACLSPTPTSGRVGTASTAWWDGAVVYEIFVRSYKDSGGDGKGDLQGLISRLDYLTDLGVDAIWLMPVFESPSYHGYDATDYDSINADYGTLADFDQLVSEAHRRGIKVILDLVMNHTSTQHPWFIDSASSSASEHRDWYVWSQSDNRWPVPWDPSNLSTWYPMEGSYYYAVFWSGMPDLNYRSPAAREEMKRIARQWLARGVDGFRLDAVRYVLEDGPGAQADVPETHAFWKEISAEVRAVNPDAMLVGEAWADTAVIADYYGSTATVPGGDELPLLFDFPLAGAVVRGVQDGSANAIGCALAAAQAAYPPGATDAPFLTNHDQVRIATALGEDVAALKTAAAILLTLPGTPFIYYGEEIGMGNGSGGDEGKRTPMPWDGTANGGFTAGTPWYPLANGWETANVAGESGDAGSLLSRYRALIRARRQSAALRQGEATLLDPNNPSILAFTRTAGAETLLVVHNLGTEPSVTGSLALAAQAAEPVFLDSGVALAGASGAWSVSLPARGSGVWRLR